MIKLNVRVCEVVHEFWLPEHCNGMWNGTWVKSENNEMVMVRTAVVITTCAKHLRQIEIMKV